MTISWYSISISPQSGGGAIFNGYFSVDNTTNLVVAFYETINGSTNFNNNILLPTGTGTASGSYLGFTHYYYNKDNISYYDNAYLSGWLQFTNYGIVLTSMSAYPQYNAFNLWTFNVGDESKNNIGIVGNNEYLNSIFTITPTSNPISNTVFNPTKQVNNNKITNAKMGMPFKPTTMTQGASFAMGRRTFINKVSNPSETQQQQPILSKKKKFNNTAGEHINKRKNNAIGNSSTNHLSQEMSFSSIDKPTVNSALRKVRSGGSVAPKKKGGVI